MLRVSAVCLLLVGMLSGCAGAPQTSPADARMSEASGTYSENSHRLSPVNQLAEQLRDFRRVSPQLIRQALLAEHRRWVGTPYQLGGESQRGIDCSALVQQVFSEAFAVELPRTTGGQVLEGRRVARDELNPGDLVFFQPPGPYRHVGVYVGEGRFLHASSSQGVIISRLDNVYWNRYYWQARRPLARTELAQRAMQVNES